MNAYQNIVNPLLTWYKENKRDLPWRKDKDPYHIWVSEIMLQQTQVKTVIPYYDRFIETLPTLKDLADADEELLLKLWEGLGYYSRVRNMKIAANQMMDDYHGIFPHSYEDLLSLKGIGAYTAGAISSIAYDLKNPAVDGNVLRVFSRLQMNEKDIKDISFKKEIENILKDIYPDEAGDFTQSLMELGALICLPNTFPKCDLCPLKHLCKAHLNQKELDYPISNKKLQKKIEPRTILLLEVDDTYAIIKNNEKGLLSNLWQFINLEGKITQKEIMKLYNPSSIQKGIHYKHIFTHKIWEIQSYYLKLDHKDSNFKWVTLESLLNDYAMASVYKPIIEEIKKNL